MIVKFQNVNLETNYGIVTGTHPDGMIEVVWDAFAALLYRLEREGKVNDFVRNNLAVRRSWIRIDDAIPTGARTEVLPLDTPVTWNDNELRLTQARMIKETTTQ
jgi:hypothetical protein